MSEYRIGTKCVQGGYTPGNGEPRQVPIIQSTDVYKRQGEAVYSMGSDEFTRHLLHLRDCGASVIGGCCGTTPEYIEDVKKSL